jgi:fructose-specific phosphotransferase system IIA component
MVLSDNLKKSNIVIKTKSQNRWDLIEELIELAVKNKEIDSDEKDEITKALLDREKSMSTGIGNGVAIPHCTSSKLKDIVCILSINQKGIDFDSLDNTPARIVILLLVPKNKLTQHIKTLANIAKVMSNNSLREKLLSLKSPESIIKAIKEFEHA